MEKKYIFLLNQINGSGETKNQICHDPNIGAVTSISNALRKLNFNGDIIVTNHNILQSKVSYRNAARSKFWRLAKANNIKLEGIESPQIIDEDGVYWHYDKLSEKNGTIFLHLASESETEYTAIYENHGGCERGYFYTNDTAITIPKRTNDNIEIAIPDLILKNNNENQMLLIEGKKSEYVQLGIQELQPYDIIENEIILKEYIDYKIERWVVLYGDVIPDLNQKEYVLFQLFSDGNIWINPKAPSDFKDMINKFMAN